MHNGNGYCEKCVTRVEGGVCDIIIQGMMSLCGGRRVCSIEEMEECVSLFKYKVRSMKECVVVMVADVT